MLLYYVYGVIAHVCNIKYLWVCGYWNANFRVSQTRYSPWTLEMLSRYAGKNETSFYHCTRNVL